MAFLGFSRKLKELIATFRCISIVDNNWVENQIGLWAFGESNWLFEGSLHSAQRAAHIMTLIQSTKINSFDKQAYLTEKLT